MKQISFLVLINLMVNTVYAEFIPTQIYQVISDVKADSIPAGMCLVKGKVYEGYSQNPVELAFVGTSYVERKYVITNEKGEYEMLIGASDTLFYFYHSSYGEILITDFDFKSQHVVTIDFITKEVVEAPIMVEKPVIYLYGEENLRVKVQLDFKGDLLFSYPSYDQGWDCRILEKGKIEVDRNVYPYLFWESKQENLNFKLNIGSVDGFYINTDSTIHFLEQKLTQLGLNFTEMTDFITYWAPRMEKFQFATVQFLIDDSYDKNIAGIQVSPKPDAQRRIFMIFQGYDQNVPPNFLVEPSWLDFERKGFTLIEWGGAELN